MLNQETKEQGPNRAWTSVLKKAAGICFWLGLIILCVIYRDKITVDSVVNFVPENVFLAACIMLGLFALKSITVIMYAGILYAANGVMFSLPVAILLNVLGTAIMTTIPFLIGKKAGTKALNRLIRKNSKLELLRDTQSKHEWFISFAIRMVRLLPADLVSMYLGASGLHYDRYICGTIMGMLPSVLCFSVMGMSIHDVSSPAFIVSACCEIGLMILSLGLYLIWRHTKKKHNEGTGKE